MSPIKLILTACILITALLFFLLDLGAKRDVKKSEYLPVQTVEPLPVLLPKPEDKRLIVDEKELQEALAGASSGDIEYMDGLADYYFRKGDEINGRKWYDKSDQERKVKGLPSKVDSIQFTHKGAKMTK